MKANCLMQRIEGTRNFHVILRKQSFDSSIKYGNELDPDSLNDKTNDRGHWYTW